MTRKVQHCVKIETGPHPKLRHILSACVNETHFHEYFVSDFL
jgi:hypothetical protein